MPELATWLLAGGIAIGAATAYRVMRPPLLRPGEQVALVGDSLAVGLGKTAAYDGASALDYELARRGCTLISLGEGATTTLQWLPEHHLGEGRLLPALRAGVRAVLVVLGTNDCHYGYGACDDYPERLYQIASAISEAGAVPVLVAMPEMPWEQSAEGAARMRAARETMRQVAAETGGRYVPPPADPVDRWSDAIHASAAGNRTWAAHIARHLDKARRWR